MCVCVCEGNISEDFISIICKLIVHHHLSPEQVCLFLSVGSSSDVPWRVIYLQTNLQLNCEQINRSPLCQEATFNCPGEVILICSPCTANIQFPHVYKSHISTRLLLSNLYDVRGSGE